MADFTYTGGGIIAAKRCGNIVSFLPRKVVIVQFAEGERAWLRYEAARGRIRSVWIKRIKIINNAATFGQNNIIYFDNLNAVFNEDDLVTNSDAIAIAIAYHQNRLYQAQKASGC